MKLLSVTTLAVGAVLLSSPGLTSAAGASIFYIPINNVQFNPSNCSNSTVTQVTLNGQYHIVVQVHKNTNGTYTTTFQSEAHGTAVDNLGNPYIFNYNNHDQEISSSPQDLPPIFGMFNDRFALLSQVGGTAVKVAFQQVYSIDASGNFNTISVAVFKGDPSCDPI